MKKLFLLIFLLVSSSIAAHSFTQFSSDREYLIITNENVIKIFKFKRVERQALDMTNLFKTMYPDYQLDQGSPIVSITISPDNKYLITTDATESKMWKLSTGGLITRL